MGNGKLYNEKGKVWRLVSRDSNWLDWFSIDDKCMEATTLVEKN